MPTSSWWVGSVPNLAAQTLSVTANATTEDVTLTAGSYYLDDSASSRSLVEALATALETHSQVSSATVIVRRNRLVRITTTPATAITWTDTTARDLLGFAGNLASNTTHNATLVSDLLWVPDRPADPEARLGRDGDIVDDTVFTSSGGTQATLIATQFDERIWNEFEVKHIPNAYGDPGTDVGGTYRTFWQEVIRRFRRFAIYRDTLHDESDDTDVGLLASNRLGPYRWRPTGGPVRYSLQREIANVHRLHRVNVPVVQDSEYS